MDKTDLYTMDLSDASWEKSSFSGAYGDNCVEVAHLAGGAVAVRDSKNRDREALRFTADEWSAFRRGIEAGELRS
jgi:hypothetical protein